MFVLLIFIHIAIYAQETNDNYDLDNEHYDFESTSGITVFGERQNDFASGSIEANVLSVLNGSLSTRRNFIETDLLENAGFRRTANIRFRSTNSSEKAMAVLHGIIHPLSLGIVPMRPFLEIDYDRLPNGLYYSFDTVIDSSELNNISPEVLSVMKIEYMLQIEFCNGILINNSVVSNLNYYTEGNISRFEMLVLELPEYPESIQQLRERYLNIELPRIRRSFARYNNPSENYLRALENLSDIRISN